MELETERLILREFEESDWHAVHEYGSDSEVVRHMEWGPNTEQETKDFIRRVLSSQQEEPRRNYQFALILKAEKRLVGACGIHVSNPENKEGWTGYVLNRGFWNQGYMTEAVKQVVVFGFSELGLHRIYATCGPDNVASAAVLEKAGLSREGRLREHKYMKGKWRDSLLYAVLEPDSR